MEKRKRFITHHSMVVAAGIVILLLAIISYSQVAMEIYAYTFIAEQTAQLGKTQAAENKTDQQVVENGAVKTDQQVVENGAVKADQQAAENISAEKKKQSGVMQDSSNQKKQTVAKNANSTGSEKKQKSAGGKKAKKTSVSSLVFFKPIKGGITSSGFGDMVSRTARHKGHDWAVGIGTEVMAAADGVVEKAYYSDSYGYNVLLKHRDGFETRYAHMSKLYVTVGQTVWAKQVLGLSGTTGQSTGPHLHFEVIRNGIFVNPLEYVEK